MATTTATTTMRNPKDSMKSTWRAGDRKEWNQAHYIIQNNGMYHKDLDQEVPKHEMTEKIPFQPEWQLHRWVLWHAAVPLVIHQAYVTLTGNNLSALAASVLYGLSFFAIGIHQVQVMRRLGHQYGFLDGEKDRNEIPDHSVAKTVSSLIVALAVRTAMPIVLAYRPNEAPLSINWLALLAEIGVYSITTDFYFYWYHRIMHQSESLWKIHRTHHLAKHPTALLSLYADRTQELGDMLVIPLMAYYTVKAMGLPMSYYEWWICGQYIVWAELAGHSGLRVHLYAPSTFAFILKQFNCELVIEDHDLHHRKGWKKSHNYGKQTRLWDRLFGTCGERIESMDKNVDYVNQSYWPMA